MDGSKILEKTIKELDFRKVIQTNHLTIYHQYFRVFLGLNKNWGILL